MGFIIGSIRSLSIYMVYDGWLVVLSILKNMKVNGKDDIPYIMENNPNVPNHQPVSLLPCCLLAMPIDVSAKKY